MSIINLISWPEKKKKKFFKTIIKKGWNNIFWKKHELTIRTNADNVQQYDKYIFPLHVFNIYINVYMWLQNHFINADECIAFIVLFPCRVLHRHSLELI